jgi:pimeloyl-ACP methyl ester carboxylesterase
MTYWFQVQNSDVHIVFNTLINGSWPASLLKVSKIVDNPWSVSTVRSEKAGLALAELIGRKAYGGRPINLMGYSLGARTIYTCLMVLAERRQFGLVENVVMMGTPAPAESRVWLALKSVVAGRLINVYSQNDYILGFLYRTSNLHYGIAGLQAVLGAEGVENYDMSSLVDNHLYYQHMVGTILKDVGWEDVDPEHVVENEKSAAWATLMRDDSRKRWMDAEMATGLKIKTPDAQGKLCHELESHLGKMKIQA